MLAKGHMYNGSQRSYVSNKVRGGLRLQSVSVETLSIKITTISNITYKTESKFEIGGCTKETNSEISQGDY